MIWVGSIYILSIPVFGLIYYFNPTFWTNPLTVVQSIYFSVVTITTLGYGDITPQTDAARLLTAFESIFGIILIGLFLNAVACASDIRREERHKKVAKNYLLAQYQNWREDLLQSCLRAANKSSYCVEGEFETRSFDFKQFRIYFSGENIGRWREVLGGMQDNENVIKDIVSLSELFVQQINTTLIKIDTENTKSLRILTQVSQELFRRKRLDIFSEDPVKYIGQFVFEILGMYTFEGKMEEDIIENAIKGL